MLRFASLLAAAVIAGLLGGCPSDPAPPSSCNDYQPPAGFDGAQPAVSFSKDVIPIFGRSCAFSTCHGASTGPANGVFLGRDPPRVYTAIVGVKGDEMPQMAFVSPSNPHESYLMRKLDGRRGL